MTKEDQLVCQRKSIQDCSKTSNYVRSRDMGSEESARKRRSWMWRKLRSGVTKLDRIKNEIIIGTTGELEGQ